MSQITNHAHFLAEKKSSTILNVNCFDLIKKSSMSALLNNRQNSIKYYFDSNWL